MKTALSIAFRHVPASEALSDYIRERVEWLEEHGGKLQNCHVVVEPERHPSSGMAKRCRVHVNVHVPGKTLVADRSAPSGEGHDDPYLAVRQAFDAIRRQMQARIERMHEPVPIQPFAE